MNILVVGQGGREHALVTAFSEDPACTAIHAWPGSDAIARLAKRPDLPAADALVGWMKGEGIDLCVIGEEKYLAAGLADDCRAAGIPAWGPSAHAAQLESSKAFAKEFMVRHNIPTGGYSEVRSEAELRAAVADAGGLPIVLKYNGLAAGKGVAVCTSESMVDDFCQRVFGEQAFGTDSVLVEEFLEGPEVSVICSVADGAYQIFPCARDYKRLGDGDAGPNTGGMGAVASLNLIDSDLLAEIKRTVVRPSVEGLQADGIPYRGFLYCGIMLTPNGPKVLEYNCRFGDPEAQAVMPLLRGPLAAYLREAADGTLPTDSLVVDPTWSVCVVFASRDYPLKSGAGDVIHGLDAVEGRVYHSGTQQLPDGGFATKGGRVCCIVKGGTTRTEAVDAVYREVEKVGFDGAQRRSDIGIANF